MHQEYKEEEDKFRNNFKMNLEKKIRKKLIETKEQKEKLLIENELIKSRIIMIFENEKNIKNFSLLSEDKKLKYSFGLLQELSYQGHNGVLNEQLLDIIKSLFGTTVGGGFGQALLEPALKYILSGLGMSDGLIKNFITSFLSKKEGFWNLFKDCGTLTTAIAESLIEAIVMKGQQSFGKDSFLFNSLRNMVGDVAAKAAIVKSLEKQLSDKVCGLFGKATKNASNVLDKVKDKKEDQSSDLLGSLLGSQNKSQSDLSSLLSLGR